MSKKSHLLDGQQALQGLQLDIELLYSQPVSSCAFGHTRSVCGLRPAPLQASWQLGLSKRLHLLYGQQALQGLQLDSVALHSRPVPRCALSHSRSVCGLSPALHLRLLGLLRQRLHPKHLGVESLPQHLAWVSWQAQLSRL